MDSIVFYLIIYVRLYITRIIIKEDMNLRGSREIGGVGERKKGEGWV